MKARAKKALSINLHSEKYIRILQMLETQLKRNRKGNSLFYHFPSCLSSMTPPCSHDSHYLLLEYISQESPIKVDNWGNDYTKCSIKRGLLDAYKRLMWNGDEGGVWDIIRHQKWRKNDVSTKSGCCSSLQHLSSIPPGHDHVILLHLHTSLLSIVPRTPNRFPSTPNTV